MTKSLPRYVRTKKAKGRTYLYFDLGKDDQGKRLLLPLPAANDPDFGQAIEDAALQRWRRQRVALPPLESVATQPDGDDLYFVRSGDAVKIGRATNVWRRLANMQANNPVELDCICRLPGRGHEEREWQAHFRESLIRGEWFAWTPKLESAIKAARTNADWRL